MTIAPKNARISYIGSPETEVEDISDYSIQIDYTCIGLSLRNAIINNTSKAHTKPRTDQD